MKNANFKTFLLAGMMTASAAGLVGTISGTFAWYTYATREFMTYTGASVKSTGQLQLGYKIKGEGQPVWKKLGESIGMEDIRAAVSRGNAQRDITDLAAVSSGNNNGHVMPIFKGQPVEGYAELPLIGDDAYVSFTICARIVDLDGNVPSDNKSYESFYNGEIYISDVFAASAVTNTKKDISKALRMFVSSTRVEYTETTDVEFAKDKLYYTYNTESEKYILENVIPGHRVDGGTIGEGGVIIPSEDEVPTYYEISYNGALFGPADLRKDGGTLDTNAQLDLDNDGKLDFPRGTYDFDEDPEPLTYGSGTQVYLPHSEVLSTFKSDGYLQNPTFVCGKAVGKNGLDIQVTIWLEGWDLLDGRTSTGLDSDAIWESEDTVGAFFNAGIQFQCDRVEKLSK